MPGIVFVPFATQLLALAVALQVVVIVGVLWRGLFGMPAAGGRRPRWLYIPLILGTGLGAWYGFLQRDLVFGASQALALFIGVSILRTPRRGPAQDAPDTEDAGKPVSRRERRAAKREAGRKGRNNG